MDFWKCSPPKASWRPRRRWRTRLSLPDCFSLNPLQIEASQPSIPVRRVIHASKSYFLDRALRYLTAAAFLDEIRVAKPGRAVCDCCCPAGTSSAASCAQSDLITNIRRVCSNNTSFRACGVPSSQSLPALAAPSIPL